MTEQYVTIKECTCNTVSAVSYNYWHCTSSHSTTSQQITWKDTFAQKL